MAAAMYAATKVDGVFDRVPVPLRGVFWMKGNGVGEELAVLQNGLFFDTEQLLLTPLGPFGWGWPVGKPAKAPAGGGMYAPALVETGAKTLLGELSAGPDQPPISYSFNFSKGGAGLKLANLDAHRGDLSDTILHGAGYTGCSCLRPICTQTFTLEARPSPLGEGSVWHRGIKIGCCNADCIPFGSYSLVKVIDAEGKPLEPHHAEFIEYMGDVQLFTWSGFAEGAEPATMQRS